MPERDPFASLSAWSEGGAMPPASEIRRRGDRIRRRRRGLIAGATAGLVAAVAVPVFALGDGGDPDTLPAGDPGSVIAPLSEADLVTGGDLDPIASDGTSWSPSYSGPPEAQAAFSPCAQEPIRDLGATRVFQRDFVLTADEGGDGTDHQLNASIAQFDSDREADAAADTIAGWYDDCLPEGADDYRAGAWTDVDLDDGATGRWMVAEYGPATASPGPGYDPDSEDGWFLDAGIVVRGDRLAVVSKLALDQEYVWDTDEEHSPTGQVLATVNERLAPDQVDPSGGISADSLPTDEDAVFFRGSDWVVDGTSRGEGINPNPCLTHPLVDLGAVDTWRRDFRSEPVFAGVEDEEMYLVATVSRFASEEAARAASEQIFADVTDCPGAYEEATAGSFRQEADVDLTDLDGPARVVTLAWNRPDLPGGSIVLDTGVLQVGDRLLVLTQRFVGQQLATNAEHPDGTTASTLRNTADRLADEVSDDTGDAGETAPPETLTPEGIDGIELGMTTSEVSLSSAAQGITPPSAAQCGYFSIGTPQRNEVDGYISTDDQVISISAPAGVTTPEGVGVGDTLADAQDAYPDLTGGEGTYSVTPEGYDDRSIVFFVEADSTIGEISLQLDASHSCFG